MTGALSALVSSARRDRIHAVHDLVITPATAADIGFVLRRVLFTDRDAEVRAAAAHRLIDIAGSTPWLADALGDRAPLVRDALLRSLANHRRDRHADGVVDGSVLDKLRRIARADRTWWVRRSAVYTLAAIAGSDELAVFQEVLADPFWRVRQAAVRVLAALGARDPSVRDELAAQAPTPTLTYLRASWGPVAIEAPVRATSTTTQLPAELLDPDPAVVTARLAMGHYPALALVELLCDPHVPLRDLALSRVAASRDPRAYLASLDWLEEARIPHVADAVEHMLDGLGDHATDVAQAALARDDRPGGARWAIGWVVATKFDELYELARTRAITPEQRLAAIPIATVDELVRWADDVDLRDAVAAELHERRSWPALLGLTAHDHPRTRALQVDALARTEAWDGVEAALVDGHHAPRAVATRWLVKTHRIDGVVQLADRDPSVREAALTSSTAAAAVADHDPYVARAAMEMLADAFHHRALPDDVLAAADLALASSDPWLRAHACRLNVSTAKLLEALADRDDMVRATALEMIATRDVAASLAGEPMSELAQLMAYTWLLRDLDTSAGELARQALAGKHSDSVRRLLGAVAGEPVADADVPHDIVDEPAIERANVPRRSFGRADFAVAPLAISGAFDVPVASLHRAANAGVDLFFWEPRYDQMTRFLRDRHDVRVIAGSYHGEPDAIEADVDTALRRLRRTSIDVFLLFWTRSPVRVDAEAYAALDRLKRAGKIRAIGFSTHHRDLAKAAIEDQPWDVVMIRHSAAHPGIETELLPTARERGTAILTFSALCYGRMLTGPDAPSARDCYRYTIDQPGVIACISAPRRPSELVDNLGVLTAPALDDTELADLRAHGLGVRAENQRFNTLLRQPTRDAAAAARDMLAAELPPADEIVDRPLPRSAGTRARTSLGTARRGRRS